EEVRSVAGVLEAGVRPQLALPHRIRHYRRPASQHAIPTLDSLTFVRHLAKKWIDLIMGS
ncbi:unnamed protein product, partial [Musa banksii]